MLEVEQGVQAERGRRLAADRRADLRARRPVRAPRPGHAHDDAGRLEPRQIGQQLERLRGRPAQRVEDLARIDHRLQPRALLGRALHGQEQREQPRLVGGARVLAQGLAERQVLGLRLRRQPRRVRRQEGERRLLVPAVLGEVEVDAADQVPGRAPAREELLNRGLRLGQLHAERRVDRVPERLQDGGVRYSAPVIGGAARASDSSSSRGGAGIGGGARCSPTSGSVQTAVT